MTKGNRLLLKTLAVVIAVAATAAHLTGQEGAIRLKVMIHSFSLAAVVGVIVMVYAYVCPGLVPHDIHLLFGK